MKRQVRENLKKPDKADKELSKLNDKKIKEIDYKVVKRRKETFHREEYTDGK